MFNPFKKESSRSVETRDFNESRLGRIELKLNLLLLLSVVQGIVLLFVAFSTFSGWLNWAMPSWTTIIVSTILLIAFIYTFRRQLPGWLAAGGRYAFSRTRKPVNTEPATASPTANTVDENREELV